MTNEHERLIQEAKRKMLRPIAQKENTKKKMASHMNIRQATLKKKRKAKRTPKAKHKKEAALTPIATKIATSLLAEDSDKKIE